MARIRTIKPEFFRHEGLYEAERETGLPLRVAFAGLWTAADKKGRFQWRPRQLKLDALPYDEIDFSRVLDALTTRGYLVKYAVNGDEFGCIPSWDTHQFINNREAESDLPAQEEGSIESTTCTREARVEHASSTEVVTRKEEGEGKGRERKTRDASREPDGFKAFWAIYPKRSARQKAAEAWVKLDPDEQLQGLIVKAVLAQAKGDGWRKNAGQFVPLPATWLNAHRWTDEIPSAVVLDIFAGAR